jgi:hypothetical protein
MGEWGSVKERREGGATILTQLASTGITHWTQRNACCLWLATNESTTAISQAITRTCIAHRRDAARDRSHASTWCLTERASGVGAHFDQVGVCAHSSSTHMEANSGARVRPINMVGSAIRSRTRREACVSLCLARTTHYHVSLGRLG